MTRSPHAEDSVATERSSWLDRVVIVGVAMVLATQKRRILLQMIERKQLELPEQLVPGSGPHRLQPGLHVLHTMAVRKGATWMS
jgi:hypothetical protein